MSKYSFLNAATLAVSALFVSTGAAQTTPATLNTAPKPTPNKAPITRQLPGDYYKLGDIFCHESVRLNPTGQFPGPECFTGHPPKSVLEFQPYENTSPGVWRVKGGDHEIRFLLK